MANVKGSALSSRVLWVQLNHGEAGISRLLPQCSVELRAIIEGGIHKAKWYPFEQFIELISTIDRLFGKGDLALVDELARHGADANLTTIYRLFYRLGTIRWVMSRAARLWNLHYDAGRLELDERGPQEIDMHLAGVPEPTCTHCRAVQGWAERSIELSGGVEVETEIRSCRRGGARTCCVATRWK